MSVPRLRIDFLLWLLSLRYNTNNAVLLEQVQEMRGRRRKKTPLFAGQEQILERINFLQLSVFALEC